MTRKHFVLIAKTVAIIQDMNTRKEVADQWVLVLTGENPRFDPDRFLEACEVTS